MKPVAWQWLDTANFRKKLSVNANKDEWTPLYTAPRELSNEEIDEIASMCSVNESGQINTREFARAILKKASEK